MDIFFTSDLHFGHTNVIKYCNRPYNSVEEMNEDLILRWNSVVKSGDVVYCLGDFSLHSRYVGLYVPRLTGRIFLVPGNHDWCHPANGRAKKKLEKRIEEYKLMGVTVLPIHSVVHTKVGVFNLCHFPYAHDTSDSRYPEWRMEDNGVPLLCGHVHQHWKIKNNMVNVGVDVWNLTPVSLTQIKEALDGGPQEYT